MAVFLPISKLCSQWYLLFILTDFHCKLPVDIEPVSNCSKDELLEYFIPKSTQDGSSKLEGCKLYSLNSTSGLNTTTCRGNHDSEETKETYECDSWEYDKSVFSSTIVTEWDLVCENAALAASAGGFYMAARGVGTFFCGWLADR